MKSEKIMVGEGTRYSLNGKISKATKEFSKEQHIGANIIADISGWIKENCR